MAALGGSTLAWPRAVEALSRRLEGGGDPGDEDFWREVRGHFLIPEGRIYLNNGTLGPSPRVVVDAIHEHQNRVASTLPPGVAWDDVKAGVSALIGGDPDGFVFPRNTTEAMSFVANGIDLVTGDEVVTTNHEHIGGLEPWKAVTRRRHGILRVADLPGPAASDSEIVDAVWQAVGPATRVLSVSHMTFTTGTVLPVELLKARCEEAGIELVVDGAHPPGMLSFDLRAIDTLYGSSPHKWMLAPQGTGLLYVPERWRERLWPTLASGGWDDLSLGAHRFNHMGTIDESRPAGLLAAAEYLTAIGIDRIEARVRALRSMLDGGLRAMDRVTVVTPEDEARKGGMVSFSIDGLESASLQRHLSRVGGVRTRVIGEYGYGWMRLSTHIYNSPDQVERVLDLIDDAVRNGIPA
ncbi:MAG: aminotransferase class V-fold PLP-dependent enzyme [Gemmatimonadota bacterium]